MISSTTLIDLLLGAAAAASAAAYNIPVAGSQAVGARALPNSPPGGYAPKVVDCPASRPTIRDAGSLSVDEQLWLDKRRQATMDPMLDLLKRAGIPNFDTEGYFKQIRGSPSTLPNIGIAVSGGGYRALLNGAGFLAAADNRTAHATGKTGIGGLLQASTYLVGLSGGGWRVGAVYSNNFSSVTQLRDGKEGSSVWRFDSSVFAGPSKSSGLSVLDTATYWDHVLDQVESKINAGFNVSITDYWGRALSYQLIDDADGGPAYTFSSIADTDAFKQGQVPFPMLVADGRAPDTTIVSLNSTVFEFNPFEMGSFDPTMFGFAPTKYLASNFSGGSVPQDGKCVAGFDQAGYVMGTSSSLFNTFLLNNITSVADVPSIVADLLRDALKLLGEANNDIAQYVPNPFRDYNPASNPSAGSAELTLVDGGEDLQNLPLQPLLQPLGGVDVIFAVDSSADTELNWPNATALRATYDRSRSRMANGTLFPAIPDDRTVINLGLNQRPVFYGSEVKNFTGHRDNAPLSSLFVFLPNAPYTAMSNVSTFTFSYSLAQRNDIIRNGFDSATQGNGTRDAGWAVCVACAILNRSFGKTSTDVPAPCKDCFTRYCWNGTLDTRDPGPYTPSFIIGNQTTKEMGSG